MEKKEKNGEIWENKLENKVKRKENIEKKEKEIWRDKREKIDGFVEDVGYGGKIEGKEIGMKERKKNIKIDMEEKNGEEIKELYKKGELKEEGD